MKYIFYTILMITVLTIHINAQIVPIDVDPGWNLVGAVTSGDVTEIITTNPPGIIEGNWYGFNSTSGYYVATTLMTANGYWVKVSQSGTIFFNTSSTFICGTSQVNYEGKIYNTVEIGTQCWLKENLDVGIMIQGTQNQTNNGLIEKYCYDNNPNNCSILGGLYQWDEAMQYSTFPGSQGICPPGWHIPTVGQVEALLIAVGGDGNALKREDQGIGAGQGTNTSGFSALLAGNRSWDGTYFLNLNVCTQFWISWEQNATNAWNFLLSYNSSEVYVDWGLKGYGFSIRCLKD